MAQKEFYKEAASSTLLLYKRDSNRILVSHGTAFAFYVYDSSLRDAIIVTCEHLTHHDTLIAALPIIDSLREQFKNIAKGEKHINVDLGSTKAIVDYDGYNLLYSIPLVPNVNLFKYPTLDLAVIFSPLPGTSFSVKRKQRSQICALDWLS